MGVNITTIAYLRVLIIEIGSTIIFMVVEAQGVGIRPKVRRLQVQIFGQIDPGWMKIDWHHPPINGVNPGSLNRWDRYQPLIYHLYIAYWVIIYHLPPIKGTRNNYWPNATPRKK